MLKKIRAWLFKHNVKRTYKLCNKYKDCNECPFALKIKRECYLCEYHRTNLCASCKDKEHYMNAFTKSYYPEEEDFSECKLTMWDKGMDRYPYEYEELF